MTDAAWRTVTGRLGWTIAITFFAASLLYVLSQFHITVPLPVFTDGLDNVEAILADFEHFQEHWPYDAASSLLFAVGFVSLAVVGATLRGAMGRDDPRSAVMAVAFLLAGVVGLGAQLFWVGGQEVANSPEYCDCGNLAEEVVSRLMTAQILDGIVVWMIDGSTVLFALGLWAFAGLAGSSGWVSGGLATFARVLAILAVLAVLWSRVAAPVLSGPDAQFDVFQVSVAITGVIAGVLTPIWAVWLARSARASAEVAAPAEGPADEDEAPVGG